MSDQGPDVGFETATPPGQSGLLRPPFSVLSSFRPSTPPPTQSPLPRTPRPQRFLSPPKTPLPTLQTVFGASLQNPLEGMEEVAPNLEAGMEIERPDSACSTYSSSSNSSVDSNTTYSTAGGSCTSPETEETFFPEKFERNAQEPLATSATTEEPTPKGKQPHRSARSRRVEWTDEMDAHLWRTFHLYQQDPKMTPFYILPGQVPPLGVCYKVARETKRTWKDAKLRGDWQSPLVTPKLKSRRTPLPMTDLELVSNRGDAMRKTSPYTWPASEAATRRRLRELCRQNYGPPSRNPYHCHQQRRRSGLATSSSAAEFDSRSSTMSPSPVKTSGLIRPNIRDPFSSKANRSMALSLTTSTASSMRPTGVLASLASGEEVHPAGSSRVSFGGIDEAVQAVNNDGNGVSGVARAEENHEHDTNAGVAESIQEFSGVFGEGEPSRVVETKRPATASSINELSKAHPTLLPPLELHSSRSPYGTWPRRLKRPESQDDDDESSTPLPPQRKPRRGTINDLFGEQIPATAPVKSRTRTRGYTISSGTNPLARRRSRPSAPLLTVTGPVSYESPNGQDKSSPLAARERPGGFGDLSDMPKRLGSPFMERLDRKGKQDTAEPKTPIFKRPSLD